MHGSAFGIGAGLRWSQDVRNYARWEYGRYAEAWLLSLTGSERIAGGSLLARLRAWLRSPTLAATPKMPQVENPR